MRRVPDRQHRRGKTATCRVQTRQQTDRGRPLILNGSLPPLLCRCPLLLFGQPAALRSCRRPRRPPDLRRNHHRADHLRQLVEAIGSVFRLVAIPFAGDDEFPSFRQPRSVTAQKSRQNVCGQTGGVTRRPAENDLGTHLVDVLPAGARTARHAPRELADRNPQPRGDLQRDVSGHDCFQGGRRAFCQPG
jgi:hypothetical protein